MKRLFIPNLNFEDDISGRTSQDSAATIRSRQEIAALMGLLADDGDCVLIDDGAIPDQLPACLKHVQFVSDTQLRKTNDIRQVVPWGYTDRTRQLQLQLLPDTDPPPAADIVLRVNGRSFLADFDFAVPIGQGLSDTSACRFGVLCRSEHEWNRTVNQFASQGYNRWIAKPEISHAGRNRLIAEGDQLNDQQQGWLQKQFQHNGLVYMEPWVQVIRECGLQYQIHPGNEPAAAGVEFKGAAELLNDAVGRYRGSVISGCTEFDDIWHPAVEQGLTIARQAAESGYFGPLGIDCMVYRNMNGMLMLRVAHDVNARYTMGRLALQLRGLLESEETGTWCLGPAGFWEPSDTKKNSLIRDLPDNVRTVVTSPGSVGGRSVRLTSRLIVSRTVQDTRTVSQLVSSVPFR